MANGNGSIGRDLRVATHGDWVAERAAEEASRGDGTRLFEQLREAVRADVERAKAASIGVRAEFHEWGDDFVVVLHSLGPNVTTDVDARRFALSTKKTAIGVFDREGRQCLGARTPPGGGDLLDVRGRPMSPQEFSRLVFEDLFF